MAVELRCSGLLMAVIILVVCLSYSAGDPNNRQRNRNKRQAQPTPSAAEIQELLNDINTLRGQQQASNMEIIQWNPALATMAAQTASGCVWGHGKPSNNPTGFSYIGQNIFSSSGTPVNLTYAVYDWYNEIQNYNYAANTCQQGPNIMCGHYTQLVWATSHDIGCAYATCNALQGAGYPDPAIFVVCNFGPGGNYPQQPYASGAACSACSIDYAGQCNNGLCTPT